MRWSWRATQVVVAAYGSDACVMGAVAMVYDSILRQPFESLGAGAYAANNNRHSANS